MYKAYVLFCVRFVFALVIICLQMMPIQAATLSLSIDNDSVFRTDREYSSGLYFRWSSDPSFIGYSVELASQIWTPSNIEFSQPKENERPYTGLTYLEGSVYHQNAANAYIFNLMLGTIGPNSGAESAQSIVHSFIGSPEPKGWEYQTYDEFVYQISGEIHQLLLQNDIGEFAFYGRGQLGNFQNEIALGATYRIGFGLEGSFGATSAQHGNNINVSLLSHSNSGLFAYVSSEIGYRFDDITIEGDKPIENDILEIKNLQGSFSTGLAWYSNSIGATLSLIIQSAQFSQSKYAQHCFGSFSFFYRY